MKIKIKGIEIQAIVGTLDHERINHQMIIIDIEFDYNADLAAASDKLDFAVDYAKIVELTIQTAKESRWYLLEALAENLILMLKNFNQINSGKVVVKKPSAIKNIEFVSATANF